MSAPQRRYRIVSAVGKGGFGTVYHAQMVGEGGFTKDVAIKLMHPDSEDLEELAARHRDEARLLGLIRHRAILQVDGLVRLNGTWAVVMEYVNGANLLEVLKAGSMPLSCVLEMGAEVSGALRVAHTAKRPDGEPLGLVHRDIKPPNIQLTTAGEVKVLDFGIARAQFDTRESETVGIILGTLSYMSPERLDGIDGPEGDIYALGVCLVEAASRGRMKKTSSSRERHAETIQIADSLLEHALGEEGDALRALIVRMMAYDAETRPNAEEVERLLWRMQEAAGPPRLSEWAVNGVKIAQQLVRSKLDGDELSGEMLTEQSQTMMEWTGEHGNTGSGPAKNKTGKDQRNVPVTWVVGAGVGLIALGLIGLTGIGISTGWLITELNTMQAKLDAKTAVQPTQVPVPVVAPEPEPNPEPDAGPPFDPTFDAAVAAPEPKPVPGAVDPKSAKPKPKAAAPKVKEAPPEAERADLGVVKIIGDAGDLQLKLKGSNGAFGPGSVPAGSYQVTAQWGENVIEVGTLFVVANQTHSIQCVELAKNCRL